MLTISSGRALGFGNPTSCINSNENATLCTICSASLGCKLKSYNGTKKPPSNPIRRHKNTPSLKSVLKLFTSKFSLFRCLLTNVINDFFTTANLSGAQSKSVSNASRSQRMPTSSYCEVICSWNFLKTENVIKIRQISMDCIRLTGRSRLCHSSVRWQWWRKRFRADESAHGSDVPAQQVNVRWLPYFWSEHFRRSISEFSDGNRESMCEKRIKESSVLMPLSNSTAAFTHMIHGIQNNVQFLTLSFLWLCHFQHIQFASGQFFPQFVQHLSIVQIFFDIFNNDSLLSKLIVYPFDQNRQQFLHQWIVQWLRLYNSTLLVVAYWWLKKKLLMRFARE